MITMENLNLGFELMGFGLIGVFTVLVLFFLMITALMRIFKNNKKQNINFALPSQEQYGIIRAK